MIYDIILAMITISTICNVILIITNLKILSLEPNHKKGKFIKKLERDTEDLSVDVFLKEVKKY